MITKYDEFILNKKIEFLFLNSNESALDFIDRLKMILPKLKSLIDIEKFIPAFLNYLKDKSYALKKVAVSSFLVGVFTLSSHPVDVVGEMIKNQLVDNDEEMKKALELAKTDVMFEEYSKRADVYLNRGIFNGTPLTGDILAKGARTAYEEHGVLVPVELALSQAQYESDMGKKGLSAENNPFNVGEFDKGTYITFNSTEDGVNSYFNLIARDYLKGKTVDDLLSKNSFVNHSGKRYASATDYENNIKNQMGFTKRWIDKNIK